MPERSRTRSELIGSIAADETSTPLATRVAADADLKKKLESASYPKPKATRIVAVSNQKGGVGKTTTTVNIAAALASEGSRVLVIDADPQGNASTALGAEHSQGSPSIYEVMVDGVPMADVLQKCPTVDNLDIVPATVDLAGAEIELVMRDERATVLAQALTEYLSSCSSRYDYVFIDCPPSLGLLTLNAFVASAEVLIPIQTEYYALEGLSQLSANIERVRATLNSKLELSTILLTMSDRRTNLSKEVADVVRSAYPGVTLDTSIPRSVRLSEAPSHGQTVISYDYTSTGALAYRAAAKEFAERGEDK